MSMLEELKARRRQQLERESGGDESRELLESLTVNADASHEFWRLVAIHIGSGTPRAEAIRKIVLLYPTLHKDMLQKHTAKYNTRARNRH